MPIPSPPVRVAPEVQAAVSAGMPVVALESTIFTHGLPLPQSLEVARAAEQQLRAAGVVPATVGVLDGQPRVGMSDADIERLATDGSVVKISLRDLPVVMAKGLSGGTTVAATADLAHRSGIEVFATGGLGGVHHGASTSFDESADLVVLARTPVVVVSAGVKSILDVSATLERIETLSLTVVGYRTTRFPGFYLTDSGHRLTYAVDDAEEVAAMVGARRALGLRAALLIANPVPPDQQLPPDVHDRVVAEAWAAAADSGVTGLDATPFLLDYIQRATGGKSLTVNSVVYHNNVAVGGDIARALTRANPQVE